MPASAAHSLCLSFPKFSCLFPCSRWKYYFLNSFVFPLVLAPDFLSLPYPETDCCIYRRCMPRAFHDWSELSFSVECRSVSAETIRLIRDHLDFHTAPELCCLSLKALSFVLKSTCPSLPSLSRAWILGPL